MRRYLIVVTVVMVIGPLAEAAFGQARPGGTASNQGGFQVSGGSGGGQGSAGNFGVGSAGQVDTNARYMRDNRQGAFVGADSGDTEFVGNVGAGVGGRNNRNIRRGGGGAVNVNRGGQGRQRNEVRIVLQLGFTPPSRGEVASARKPAAVAARLADRMERSNWIQNRSQMEVSIDEGTATLRGVVSTEHDRVLAERLALLEGGIRKVENLLEVQGAEDAAEDAPALLEPTP